jgi:hypothetical protein
MEEALVLRTKPDQLVALRPDSRRGARKEPEDLARIELQMETLERDLPLLDESYGRDVVNLTIARGLREEAAGEREGGEVPGREARRFAD